MSKKTAIIYHKFTLDFTLYYQWVDRETRREFQGQFSTVEDTINAIPQSYRIIKVRIVDNDGKAINYTIDRDKKNMTESD